MSVVYRNIEFHNVEELIPCDKGYAMQRIPSCVSNQLNSSIRDATSQYSTGVELRFKIKGDSATVLLSCDPCEEAQIAYIYNGAFQGGWQFSSQAIHPNGTKIMIEHPKNLEELKKITDENKLCFQPEVVRIVLPSGKCYFHDVEGEVEPPLQEEVPLRNYLAYGSSITHGSLALAAPYAYPFRIAQKLGCDYINLGFAGSAHLEKEMAEYIVSRKDWDFATVEMGINMLGEEFSEELFEQRVDDFTEILSKDGREVFATSVFGFNIPGSQEKAKRFRKIVAKYAGERLIFIDGLELLNEPCYISQDLVHPTAEGMEQIVARWYPIIAGQSPIWAHRAL